MSSSSSDSALAGVSVFGGICIVFSGMCGSVERFRQRMKLEIADRDIVILLFSVGTEFFVMGAAISYADLKSFFSSAS